MDFCIPGDGRWKINYKAIDSPSIPGPNGKVQFLFQGSNPWYIKLQARNTKLDIFVLLASLLMKLNFSNYRQFLLE